MKEVIPGIHQLQLPLPTGGLDYVNIYLIQGDNGYLLVDTGWSTEEAFSSLKRQLAELGVGFEDISQILITHIHPDHYGLAGKLKQLSQAKIFLHYLEKNLIESRYVDMADLLKQIERWLSVHGVTADELPQIQTASLGMEKFVAPALPDTMLFGNETISTGVFSFRVIWTPGHSPGHVCLYEPVQRVMVSGDHILPTITPNIGLHPQSSGNPLGDYLNSINEIKELDVDLVLPGHENPFNDLPSRIEQLIEHHRQRNTEILLAVNGEAKTAYQISSQLTWMSDTSGASWQKLNPWDKRLAILETIAHLESLRADGKVTRLHRDGTTYYQASDTGHTS